MTIAQKSNLHRFADFGLTVILGACLAMSLLSDRVVLAGVSRPLMGAIIHTEYTAAGAYHWLWYQRSLSFALSSRRPKLGFYNQADVAFDIEGHHRQLEKGKFDYALFSWYGGLHSDEYNEEINATLANYWHGFSRDNRSDGYQIKMAALIEFASVNYKNRLLFIKKRFYETYPDDVLMYDSKPVIALGFAGTEDPSDAAISYARELGFYVVSSKEAQEGGAAFVGITMRDDDIHRATKFSAVVSPGIDVSGKGVVLQQSDFSLSRDEIGCGDEYVALEHAPCNELATSVRIHSSPQYGEGRFIALLSGASTSSMPACVVVRNCQKRAFWSCSGPGAELRVKFLEDDTNCEVAVAVEPYNRKGDLIRAWIILTQQREISVEEYDRQWCRIAELRRGDLPQFITVASFNSWEEGTQIEDNSVDGDSLLERSAFWIHEVREENREHVQKKCSL